LRSRCRFSLAAVAAVRLLVLDVGAPKRGLYELVIIYGWLGQYAYISWGNYLPAVCGRTAFGVVPTLGTPRGFAAAERGTVLVEEDLAFLALAVGVAILGAVWGRLVAFLAAVDSASGPGPCAML
jgi:hypothetical protein